MKLAILADLHIHNFSQFSNFRGEKNFRLNQFLRLAAWIVETARKNNIEGFIIAGDLLQVCSPDPEVVLVVSQFLKILASHGRVWILHGQHDLNARKVVGEFKSKTLISLMQQIQCVHRIEYLHEEMEKIGGLNFYFRGWVPDYDIDCPDGTDVFIGHTTLDGSSTSHFKLDGTRYKNSKFKIGFFGDIHKFQVLGNCIVPGVLIQGNFGDHPDNALLTFDTKDYSTERIYPPAGMFLKFISDHGKEDDLIDEENLIVYQKKSYASRSISEVVKISSVDPEEIIKELIDEDQDLGSYHNQIRSKLEAPREPINFDFILKSIKVENYLHVKSLNFEFDCVGKLITLVGRNGHGKSTFTRVIKAALEGINGRKEALHGDVKLDIELSYRGQEYRIVRGYSGSNYIEFYINDQYQDHKAIGKFNKAIIEHLPFIPYLDRIFLEQSRRQYLASYKVEDRIAFLSDLLALDLYEKLESISDKERKDLDKEITKIKSSINFYEGELQRINRELIDQPTDNFSEEEVLKQIEALNDAKMKILVSEQNYERELKSLEKEEGRLDRDLRGQFNLQTELTNQLTSLHNKTCYVCGSHYDNEEAEEKLRIKLSECERQIQDLTQAQRDNKIAKSKLSKPDTTQLSFLGRAIVTLSSKISDAKLSKKQREDLKRNTDALEEARLQLQSLIAHSQVIERYLKIVGYKGQAMGSLLEKISVLLSDDKFQIQTLKTYQNGNVVPDFTVLLYVNGAWVELNDLSGGQRTLVDIYAIDKLLSLTGKSCGFMVIDEFLSDTDSDMLAEILDILEASKIEKIFIVTHDMNFPRYDSMIKTQNFTYTVL